MEVKNKNILDLGPPAQALFRYNLFQDFRAANFATSSMFTILRSPTSFFPHPDGFYSTGACNGVSQQLYREYKGRIDAIYQHLAQAFNGQFKYPLPKDDADIYAQKLGRIWGNSVALIDGMETIAKSGAGATLSVCLKRHESLKDCYRVDGYIVMSAK